VDTSSDISAEVQLNPELAVELVCAAVRTVIELIEPKLAGTVDTTEHAAMACPQNNKPTPYNPTLPLT
jgi:hypothetical protein